MLIRHMASIALPLRAHAIAVVIATVVACLMTCVGLASTLSATGVAAIRVTAIA